MPGHVVAVHHGPDFAEQTATTLKDTAGFDATSFNDPLAAWR